MQDPTIFQQIKSPQFPDQEQIKCPRCDSTNTKFCYYNNYNLSQPRHFCKNCRRYWTKGGALRNIPVGGGIRKNTKRSSNPNKRQSSSSSSATQISHQKPQPTGIFTSAITGIDPDHQMLDISGSFSSLLASSNGQFGNLLVNPNNVSREVHHQFGEFVENSENCTSNRTTLELQSNGNQGNLLGISSGGGGGGGGGDSSCWNGGNGWPDLAIYTPGSNFQ